MGNIKFNALTPKVLDENNEIYDEALDYAFSNNDIKNIAITGIYGAGKSTVWNTYVCKRGLNNVITVSLGKYENYIEDDDNRQKEVSVTKLNDTDSDVAEDLYGNENQKAGGIDDENRVEMQIINQILSQIDPKKIPLSKYCFKSNKSKLSIHMHSLALISMICSILLWTTSDTFASFVNESYKTISGMLLMFFCAILLFVPLYYYVYIFYRGNKFRISKISFNGAEADMDKDMDDETVLDRDIKELVYLLGSSGTKIVVFEDLDRYNNISIYTKLRELNFILNHYVNVKGYKNPVRFIYMLKDGLFFSKNRTKFFDFIIPIVPIVDSGISEYYLDKFVKDIGMGEEVSILADIALYVDDMRLLKNIVNEYIVYSRILQLENKNLGIEKSLEYSYLNNDMLFALITLKNILPNEFELLQEGRGYIKDVLKKLESKLESKEYNNTSYKTIISELSTEEWDELFPEEGLNSLKSHDFDLIRFLIVNGLLDNSYGKFTVDLYKVDTSNILKKNDIIYIKRLKEGRSLDLFLDVETPVLVIERLTKDDFRRDNILNMNIFKTCLDKDMKDNLIAITESITLNKKYEDLWEILDKLGLELGGKYFNILLYNNKVLLYDILFYFRSKTIHTGFDGREPIHSKKLFSHSKYIEIFNNILISILITEHTGENQLKSITGYVELGNSTDIIEQIYKIYYEIYDEMCGYMECVDDYKEYKKRAEHMNTKKKELDNFIKNVNFIGAKFDISKIVQLKDDYSARLCDRDKT